MNSLEQIITQLQNNHYFNTSDSNIANILFDFTVGMIRVDFGPISETVYIDIILSTIIER
jgi:hypothetical protein